jgi:hypothetical protein
LKSINPRGNIHLKKKFRIFRIYLGWSFTKILPNSISLWNNFLEKLKIKSYKQSTHSQTRNWAHSWYRLQYISKEIRKIMFCWIRNWIRCN